MKITVLRKMRYGEHFIYVMQFGYDFQYLIPFGSDIYQDHITLKPRLLKRILWNLKVIKSPYSKEQLIDGEEIVLSGAMKTLDTVQDPKYKEKRRKAIKKKEKGDCVWQAREGKVGFYYHCLTHNVIVKMEDGVQPSHK